MPKKPIKRIKRAPADVRPAAMDLSKREVQYIIRDYLNLSKCKSSIHSHHHILEKKGIDSPVYNYILRDTKRAIENIKNVLDVWTENSVAARWVKSFPGFGPIVSAGLSAYIDIRRTSTSSSFCQYAGFGDRWPRSMAEIDNAIKESIGTFGYEPTDKHLDFLADRFSLDPTRFKRNCYSSKGRLTWPRIDWVLHNPPWQQHLHAICLRTSLVIVRSIWAKDNYYRHIYEYQKKRLVALSESGAFAAKAAKELREKDYSRDTVASKAYRVGKYPHGRLDRMARRAALKTFLRHFWMVEYRARVGEMPPEHYAIDVLGGSKRLVVPNWPKFE